MNHFNHLPDTRTGARSIAGICILGLLVTGLSACSVKRMAVTKIADSLAEGGTVYASDDDPELVGAAVPFALKTLEGLLAQAPSHRGTLLALTRGFTQYAYAYVHVPADEAEDQNVAAAYAQRDRARRLYLRARDYGLRGLDAGNAAFSKRLRKHPTDAVAGLDAGDVALAYWTAVSWAAGISLGKDDASLVADLPAVEALAYRALELDEAFDHGAIHAFLVSFEASRPGATPEQRSERIRLHYERAVALSGGQLAGPHLALAEVASATAGERSVFDDAVSNALAVDVNARPEWRLANLISQRRARWLRSRTDHYFID